MKKKLLILLVAGALALPLTACYDNYIVANSDTTAGTMFIQHKLSDGYSVLEERDTGVCYLVYEPTSRLYGITVMLNPDGTPKIWEHAGG